MLKVFLDLDNDVKRLTLGTVATLAFQPKSSRTREGSRWTPLRLRCACWTVVTYWTHVRINPLIGGGRACILATVKPVGVNNITGLLLPELIP